MMALALELVRAQGDMIDPVPSATQVAIDTSATSSISMVVAISSTFDMLMPGITETPSITVTETFQTPMPTLTPTPTLSSTSAMISMTSVSVAPPSTMPPVTSTTVAPMPSPTPIVTTGQVY